jgi:peptide/nickel transport system substrate-binding protein
MTTPLPPLPRRVPGRWLGAGALLLVVALMTLAPALASRLGRPPGAPADTTAAATPAAAASPRAPLYAASTYREAIAGAPATLNPLLAASDAEFDAAQLLFAGLTRTDGRGGVEPDLAESWSVSETGTVYTFALRQDAYWHDGLPVTSRDVLFTVRLMQSTAFPISPALGGLWRTIQVDLPGPHTVRFTLNEPFAPFLTKTTFPLLPAHRLHGVYPGDLPAHEFSRRPVGAGPYRVVDGLREGDLLLERHPQYHGPAPRIERILLRFYQDLDDALQALQSGAVDGVAGVPGQRLPALQNQPGLTVQRLALNGYTLLLLNLRRPLFQQREVRQALALAIDRAALVREALAGAGEPATSPIVASSWAYAAQPATGTIHEARALLEKAGWFDRDGDGVRERDGRPLALTLLTTDSAERSQAAVAIARQLGEAGLRVTIMTVTPDELVNRHLASHDFDAALFGWAGLGDDPDPYGVWHSSQAEHGFNFAGWSLPRADELLESGRQIRDQAARQSRYADFQRLFAEEAPSIILYTPYYHLITTERVHVVAPGPINRPADRFRTIARWTIDAEPAVG